MTETKPAATQAATALPKIGEAFHGGIYAGITTGKDGVPYALIVLTHVSASDLTWKQAMKFAADLGGDLPSRPEAALLFANLKDKFEPTWYWTNEEFSKTSAWCQGFSYGDQSIYYEGYELSARAVRRLVIQSFVPFEVAK